MPSSSAKQAKFMRAVANSPEFAKKVGVPQKVGKDFEKADKGRKFSGGGMSNCGTKRMNMGGPAGKSGATRRLEMEGYHMMPDGKPMKNSEHGMKSGGSVRGYGKARGGKACKIR